jgi:hypothetical protein
VLISPPIRHQRFIRCKQGLLFKYRRKGGKLMEENLKQKRGKKIRESGESREQKGK